MTPFEISKLYKEETGSTCFDEIEVEFEVWRSKGQWILNIDDAEKFQLAGRFGIIRFMKPDEDYINWLEEKVLKMIKNGYK
jgi:hypothetical protein